MSRSVAQVSVIPKRRGVILLTLHANYPAGVSYRLISQRYEMLADSGDDLRRDLAYLAERGFAVETAEHVRGLPVLMYRVTAAGIDLVEGVTSDPGIRIEREE